MKINLLYGIRISTYEKVTRGFLSENYFLSDSKNKFFLKKYRFDDSNRINEIHAAKSFFCNGGIPVILPLPLLDGTTYFECHSAYYALFPFIEGRHLERGELTEAAIVSLGQMLGKIHLLGKESKLAIGERFKVENKEKVLKKIDDILLRISEVHQHSDFDKVALENVQLKKELLLKNESTFESLGFECDHLIHGDYLDSNVFFDENDHVKWVFDFEKTNYSPRAFELFRSMFLCIWGGDIARMHLDKMKKYIEAYSSVYPISNDEIRRGLQLSFVKAIHGFWVEGEHYLKGNTRVDQFLFEDYKRIKYFSKDFDEMVAVLTN